MVDSTERLEVSFTSSPFSITSALVIDGKIAAQETFQQAHSTELWAGALRAIAQATKAPSTSVSSMYRNPPSAASGSSRRDHQENASVHSRSDLPKRTRIADNEYVKTGKYSPSSRARNAAPISPSRQSPTSRVTQKSSSHNDRMQLLSSSEQAMLSSLGLASGDNQDPITEELDFSGYGLDTASIVSTSSENPFIAKSPAASGSNDTFTKRLRKLELLIDSVRNYTKPSLEEHNEKVANLYSNSTYAPHLMPTSMEQLGQVLGELGKLSNAIGIVYSLLSWEIYRREEKRLIVEEKLSPKWAAKRINDKMSEQSNRPGTAKDWASDRRRAAGIVFDALAGLSVASKSFAILLLADLTTLDGLVKIAHIPALREHFTRAFKEIHEARRQQWDHLAQQGYRVFDFEEFLRTRGQCQETQLESSMIDLNLPSHSSAASFFTQSGGLAGAEVGYMGLDEALGRHQSSHSQDRGSMSVYSEYLPLDTMGMSSMQDGNYMDNQYNSSIYNTPLDRFSLPQAQDFDVLFPSGFDSSTIGSNYYHQPRRDQDRDG